MIEEPQGKFWPSIHNFGCRWIERRGLRLEEGSHP